MNKYLKYLKAFAFITISILVLIIFLSILYYFNIINDNIISYMKLIVTSLSMLIGGIYIGKKANKKGYLEGLKVGILTIILMFIFGYLAFGKGIDIKSLLYYFILLVSSILGSMIGINKKTDNK